MTIKFISKSCNQSLFLNKVFPRFPYSIFLCANKFLELAEISTLLFNQLFTWASLRYTCFSLSCTFKIDISTYSRPFI